MTDEHYVSPLLLGSSVTFLQLVFFSPGRHCVRHRVSRDRGFFLSRYERVLIRFGVEVAVSGAR